MITFELAKQLKDARYRTDGYVLGHTFYPHPSSPGWSKEAREAGVIIDQYVLANHLADLNEGYCVPTLEELITACGDKFDSLKHINGHWFANWDISNQPRDVKGSTAEEAVARLWLALHANGDASA